MSSTAANTNSRTLVASVAGGPARQFRVQVLDDCDSTWKLFATFKQRDVANDCARRLASEGATARVLAVRICPTAA